MTTLEQAARQALEALKSSRVFVTTREKIKHPEGTEAYDEIIESLRQALEQKQEPAVEWEQELLNLLCRIHRDGGHYIVENGIRKAIDDADLRVAKLNAINDTAPQPKQEPVAWMVEGCLCASKEVAQKMEGNKYTLQPLYTSPPQHKIKHEPVAWMVEGSLYESKEVAQKMGGNAYTLQALYTELPQREWVELTEEDISTISKKLFGSTYDAGSDRHFARAIEAKLKEKNT